MADLKFIQTFSSNGPLEWFPCSIEITLDDKAPQVEDGKYELSLRGGGKLELHRHLEKNVLCANLPPLGPGNYELELRCQGQQVILSPKSAFTVYPRKFASSPEESLEAFNEMLDDLQSKLPYGIAFSLQKLGGLAGVRMAPLPQITCLIEREFILLKRAIEGGASDHKSGQPGLLKLLTELDRNPQRCLVDEEPWVKAHAARRPRASGLVRALRRPYNLDKYENRLHPKSLPDRRARSTVDIYENRVALFLHDLVKSRLRRLKNDLDETLKNSPKNKKDLKSRLEEIKKMDKQLARARQRASFLDEVSPLSAPPSRVSQIQLKIPVYRAVWDALRELLRNICLHLDSADLEATLNNLPDLYQCWGTLQVLQALLSVGEDRGFEVESQNLVRFHRNTAFVKSVFPEDQAVLILKHRDNEQRRITMFSELNFYSREPDRTYKSSPSGKKGFFSGTFPKRPDICILSEIPGKPPLLILFDPKYKLASDKREWRRDESAQREKERGQGPALEDIDKMHTYRDAIRYKKRSKRPVVFAGIIYPGKKISFLDDKNLEPIVGIPGKEDIQGDIKAVLKRFLDKPARHP